MTRRIVIGGSGLLLVAVAVWMALRSRPVDPVYDGKPLRVWLQGHVASSAADPPYNSPGWKHADQVLRRAGTNALPTLVEMLAATDPPRPLLWLIDVAPRWIGLPSRYRHSSLRHEEARYGFEVLGPAAAPAVPSLIEMYQGRLSPDSRRCVAGALGSIGSAARPALPVLLQDFGHPDGQARFDAVTAVLHIGGEPDVIIPAMVPMLRDSKREIRWNAAVALSLLHGRARAAVPPLQDALRAATAGPDRDFQRALETALWRIAPEEVGYPLVVELAGPMVEQGRTSESLELVFNGERRTLIPAGKAVPCLAQFWDSEPRGVLHLYRGSGEAGRLGGFEVPGLAAPPTNLNISVLCVVTDQRVVLCARDNNTEGFLRMQRAD